MMGSQQVFFLLIYIFLPLFILKYIFIILILILILNFGTVLIIFNFLSIIILYIFKRNFKYLYKLHYMLNDNTYWFETILTFIYLIYVMTIYSMLKGDHLIRFNMQLFLLSQLYTILLDWLFYKLVKLESNFTDSQIFNQESFFYIAPNTFIYSTFENLLSYPIKFIKNCYCKIYEMNWVNTSQILYIFLTITLTLQLLFFIFGIIISYLQLQRVYSVDISNIYFIILMYLTYHVIFMIRPILIVIFGKDFSFNYRFVQIAITIFLIIYLRKTFTLFDFCLPFNFLNLCDYLMK
jgi:hypothetical protein